MRRKTATILDLNFYSISNLGGTIYQWEVKRYLETGVASQYKIRNQSLKEEKKKVSPCFVKEIVLSSTLQYVIFFLPLIFWAYFIFNTKFASFIYVGIHRLALISVIMATGLNQE